MVPRVAGSNPVSHPFRRVVAGEDDESADFADLRRFQTCHSCESRNPSSSRRRSHRGLAALGPNQRRSEYGILIDGSQLLHKAHDLTEQIGQTITRIAPDADVTVHPKPVSYAGYPNLVGR